MKKIFLIFLTMINLGGLHSQNWEQVGSGASFPVIFFAERDSSLYLAGQFRFFDSVEVKSIARWDGNNAYSLSIPEDHCAEISLFCESTSHLGIYENDLLFSSVYYTSIDSVHFCGLARWDGFNWQNMGNLVSDYDPPLDCGVVVDTKEVNGRLYAGGIFSYADGEIANSIAYWENDAWHSMGFPTWDSGDVPFVFAIEYYDGKIWAGGNFYSIIDGQYCGDLAYWDSTGWHVPEQGLNSGASSDIGDMIVYHDDLYVCGDFTKGGGYAGTMIMRLHNGQWESVGDPFSYYCGRIFSMKVINDELYVVGNFDELVHGLDVQRIAKWNGERWCSFGSEFDNAIGGIIEWNGDIYIGGGFKEIDGQPINYIAKWIGGDYVADCTDMNAVPASPEVNTTLQISPNPGGDRVSLSGSVLLKQPTKLCIYNILGVLCHEEIVSAPDGYVSVLLPSNMPSGQYYFQLTSEDKAASEGALWIKE